MKKETAETLAAQLCKELGAPWEPFTSTIDNNAWNAGAHIPRTNLRAFYKQGGAAYFNGMPSQKIEGIVISHEFSRDNGMAASLQLYFSSVGRDARRMARSYAHGVALLKEELESALKQLEPLLAEDEA